MFPSNSWGFQQQANNQTSNSPRWRKKGGKSRQTWSRKKERFESIGGYSGIGKIKLQRINQAARNTRWLRAASF